MPEALRAHQRIRVRGRVQGVGFRPHVWRLAQELGLAGWVRNDGDGVEIDAEGDAQALARLRERLAREAPPLARVADVVALAVVLYEMLAGIPPFHRDGAMATFKAILEESPISLRVGRPDVPADLDAAVLAALEKDPSARTADAAALRDALSAILSALPAEELPAGFFDERPADRPDSETAPTLAF